ncbi:SlyX family protein [Rhodobacter sp. NSM]|uniref:SlyX family protein n=1 Tax=Rhodobacter sp. NSM TaxID=3457501 RepID=UPI003FD18100
MEDRIEAAEVQIAHLERNVEDLSEVVARQSAEIAQLRRRVEMLLEREADREAEGVAVLADQRPPHY